MIRLHPLPEVEHDCPTCHMRLEVAGWHIPGMRCLAELHCPLCGRDYYGDLPVNEARRYPVLLDRETGAVHDPHQVAWWASWLRDSYSDRTATPLGFREEQYKPIRRPVLLNCLDRLYGHCLLKLLNAQWHVDHAEGHDLVILVPRFLRWMTPRQGVAAIWTIDLPLRRGGEWNDWLAEELRWRLSESDAAYLSTALPHPHPDEFAIQRFTGVAPFDTADWNRLLPQPFITFIWRDDRLWGDHEDRAGCVAKINALYDALRVQWPRLDGAVVGLGDSGGLAPSLSDLRKAEADEQTERRWCRRYAASHLVIGIHGSNMLLPSAHAGVTLSLMPPTRWNNAYQDMLPVPCDAREAAFRYRCLPASITPLELARIVDSILTSFDEQSHLLWTQSCRHAPPREAQLTRCMQGVA